MAVRLLRESSDTPNIANKDDVRMARYAYGGTDGIVKNYGSELSYDSTNKSFSIGSGMLVVQGWEVMVDGLGWSIDFSAMPTGLFYYSIYVEVNAEVESATIKSLYDTSSYPSVDPGDDLTQRPSGTARLLIYSVQVSNQNVISVRRDAPVLEHLVPYVKEAITGVSEKVKNLESRLSSGSLVPKYSDKLHFSDSVTHRFTLNSGVTSFSGVTFKGAYFVSLYGGSNNSSQRSGIFITPGFPAPSSFGVSNAEFSIGGSYGIHIRYENGTTTMSLNSYEGTTMPYDLTVDFYQIGE